MYKILILLISLFFLNFANGQEQKEVTNYYNLVGINNGNAQIKSMGKIDKNGFSIGEWKFYSINGKPDYIINFTTTISKKYFPSGELKEKGKFNPDTCEHIGKWIYYNKNGSIKSIIHNSSKLVE